ncbi:MAG: tetratricopeptide repeat protein [Hyphomicrobiales bacterium]|nr:tetratricopeptide repeat protein [Hyphomicrobiales bacterium]
MSETRKLAAILVADVVGYSRLAGADEERTLARLRALRSDLIDPSIALHHGRVVKRTGDGSIIDFRSVVDAVRCAVEVQSGMVERNGGLPPEKRIEFRIGVHLGDVVEEADGDLMGDGVNVAARIEGICRPGAICLSEDAYRQVKQRFDLAATDLGQTHLKNIAEPIRIYSLEVGAPAPAKFASEITPPAPQPSARPSNKRSALAPLAAALAALLILIAGGAWWLLGANRPAAVPNAPPLAAQRFSIVVLPFANLSGDPAQDYLADALTDELTTDLARLPDTFVIARNTAFTYRGKPVDAKAIGKDLGVRYVLEGSVQPSGDRVRVNAQLIDAGSGAHLWADQFDAARAGLLDTQDEIVTRLARALDIQLTEVEAARLKRTPAANPTAEDLALQCVAGVLEGRFAPKEADYDLCEQALALDPDNVRALTYSTNKFRDPLSDVERADATVSKALALDPNYADAHVAKAWILWRQRRLDEAIVEDERALALNPAFLDAYVNMGLVYRTLGRFEESLGFFDKAIRRSPNDPAVSTSYAIKAGDHIALKQYDQALESAHRAIAISPSFPLTHWYLVTALLQSGQDSQAHEALRRYLALPGVPATVVALKQETAKYVNERDDPRYVEKWDQLVEAMRKAGLPEE